MRAAWLISDFEALSDHFSASTRCRYRDNTSQEVSMLNNRTRRLHHPGDAARRARRADLDGTRSDTLAPKPAPTASPFSA
jgi:hypothetical protein